MHHPASAQSRTTLAKSFTRILLSTLPLLGIVCLVLSSSLQAQERAATHKVPPMYPPIARQMRVTGIVVVTATVDASGRVVKAQSTSGNRLLAPAAIEAVKQWRFTTGDGTVTFNVSVNFEFEKG